MAVEPAGSEPYALWTVVLMLWLTGRGTWPLLRRIPTRWNRRPAPTPAASPAPAPAPEQAATTAPSLAPRSSFLVPGSSLNPHPSPLPTMPPRRNPVLTVTVTMRVDTRDRRMSALRVSRIMEEHAWLVADELTGLLTYGGRGVRVKPAVEVTQVVVREGDGGK